MFFLFFFLNACLFFSCGRVFFFVCARLPFFRTRASLFFFVHVRASLFFVRGRAASFFFFRGPRLSLSRAHFFGQASFFLSRARAFLFSLVCVRLSLSLVCVGRFLLFLHACFSSFLFFNPSFVFFSRFFFFLSFVVCPCCSYCSFLSFVFFLPQMNSRPVRSMCTSQDEYRETELSVDTLKKEKRKTTTGKRRCWCADVNVNAVYNLSHVKNCLCFFFSVRLCFLSILLHASLVFVFSTVPPLLFLSRCVLCFFFLRASSV